MSGAIFACLWILSTAYPVEGKGLPGAVVFEDNFDKGELSDAWIPVSQTDERLLSVRTRANAQVRDGTLQLLNRRADARGKPWTTGFVRSRQTFRYGYFEAKVRYAAAPGLDNAFWLISDTPVSRGGMEIDINEGYYPNIVTSNVHTPNHPQMFDRLKVKGNASRSFHVFGLLWQPDGQLTWYVDGRAVRSAYCTDCNRDARVVFSGAVLKAKPAVEYLDGTAMVVDWIRVRQVTK